MRISTTQIQQQGIDAITRLSAQTAQTQQQVATGRRVNQAADDPAGAARIVRLNQEIATRERYLQNTDSAEAQLQQEEATLSSMTEVLQRVRELTLQAGDPAYTVDDLASIGAELSVRVDEVLALANSRDSQGNFLFGGYQGDRAPFVVEQGTVRYRGDSGSRELAIAADRRIAISDPGVDLFDRAKVNFQSVRVSAAAGTAPQPAQMRAEFSDAEALATVSAQRLLVETREVEGRLMLDVKDAATGARLGGAAAGTRVGLEALGLDLTFDQAPIAGERYLLEIHEQQGLLTTVNAIASALTGADSPLTETGLRTAIDQTLVGVDAALEGISGTQSQVGARLNAIDSTRVLHEDLILRSKEILSEVRDIDFAEAVSDLSYQSFLLEAAQQSFVRVSNLSLFNRL